MTIDPHFYEEIKAHYSGRNIDNCLQCGTCSSACPVLETDAGYNVRAIISKTLLGLRDEVLHDENIWLCARCNQCIAKCPKDVRPGDIVHAVRAVALESGYTNNPGARHSLFFGKSIKRHGVLNEAFLPLYTLRMKVLGMIGLSMRLMFKGKLPNPIPMPIAGIEDIRKLYDIIEEKRAKQK
ncbi:MAG: CoB--CoM heterodisulfide reductase subunit C [Myxococcota bacterium]